MPNPSICLKQWHTKRAFKHRTQILRRIADAFKTSPPPQIGMHHIPLNRAGPDNRHLHDKIVETAWLQPWQHRHLGPRFNLKHANRLTSAQHVIGGLVLGRH